MPAKPRCYVASPLGFSEAGRTYYVEVFLPALEELVDPVDPWALDVEVGDGAASTPAQREARARTAGQRNLEALESCELLVAVLDGQEVDSGTASELGFGAARGLTCFGLRSDYRESGEPGATVNLQVEAFILMSGGKIVATLTALLEELRRLVRQNGAAHQQAPAEEGRRSS